MNEIESSAVAERPITEHEAAALVNAYENFCAAQDRLLRAYKRLAAARAHVAKMENDAADYHEGTCNARGRLGIVLH